MCAQIVANWGGKTPYKHQARVFDDFCNHCDEGMGTFTLVCSFGGGKSILLAACADAGLKHFGFEQILLCSPTTIIRDQLVDEFASLGIKLSASVNNRRLIRSRFDSECHGFSITYHQLASFPDLFLGYCSQKKTFGGADEGHHLAENLSWGEAFRTALEPCPLKFIMTATPCRSDNKFIPFVEYEEVVTND